MNRTRSYAGQEIQSMTPLGLPPSPTRRTKPGDNRYRSSVRTPLREVNRSRSRSPPRTRRYSSDRRSIMNRGRSLVTPPQSNIRGYKNGRSRSPVQHGTSRYSAEFVRYSSESSAGSARGSRPRVREENYYRNRPTVSNSSSRHRRSRTDLVNHSGQAVPHLNENTLLEKLVDVLSKQHKEGVHGHGAQNVIPEFDPQSKTQTMKDWLAKIDESAHIYGWTERQTIFYVLPKLKGLAKRWYDGLTSVKYNWTEWREKLMSAFPCHQNYADLLSEMLSRRTRRNETLEEYYYDKTMLINRCEIKGKKAVDCLTQGIYDVNIRMNVQGADLPDPESVLKYFRNITNKVQDVPRKFSSNTQYNYDQTTKKIVDSSSRRSTFMNLLKCYNCSEAGHVVSNCPKEVMKCRKCRRYGHPDNKCPGPPELRVMKEQNGQPLTGNTANTKNVLNITTENKGNDKYYKQVVVNGRQITSFVDLGSQCTLLSEDIGRELNLIIDKSNLPTLKGFASGSLVPAGRVNIRIVLDGLDELIEAYLVDPHLLPADILVGQTLTELPHVRACKTNNQLLFYKEVALISEKLTVTCAETVLVEGTKMVDILTPTEISGSIYVDVEPCMREGKEYMILPGLYSIQDGKGTLVLISLNAQPFNIPKGTLLARGTLVSNTQMAQISNTKPDIKSVNSIAVGQTNPVDRISIDQINVDNELDPELKDQLCDLLNEHRDCFAFSLEELGKTSCAEMRIELKDNVPVVYRPYRLSLSERGKVNTIVTSMLDNGIIRESTSEYSSPIILVAKKNGDARLCVDYRALNRKTVKEKFPMPLIDDQIDRLSGQLFFTTLDLTSGYHQVPVAEESKHLTAFVTPDGHYEYNRMPFGLTNAPAVFQRLILKLLKQHRIPGVLAYMDDIIIPSKTLSEGMERLKDVLILLKEANLTLNLAKCNFFQRTIQYLGFEISSEGVRPGQQKTNAVTNFKTPQNVHEVRQFVGLSSFFRRFVQSFATIARPLTSLTKAKTTWVWGEEQDKAFSRLKDILTTRPVLAIFNPDYETELHTDASSAGLGGILLQRSNKGCPLRPVAYFSRQTTTEEQRFHSYELETLAVVASLQRFRVYLLGIEFKVVTDCNALRTTLTKRDLIPRIARWWLLVQEYTFSIEYRPGAQMAHADALSRNSDPDVEPLSVWQVGEVHWLQSVQMSDPRLCHIKAVLDSKSREAKDIQDNYVLKDGKIFRRVNDELRWAVPRDARWKIMQQCHDEAGHFSYDKTLEKARRDYWFPKMAQFIKKYVRACIPCAYAKQPGGKKQGFLHPIPKPTSLFQCLHIDHLGPFPKSKRGNVYILGIIDSFTKFIILRAVKNTKSKTSIEVLRDVFALFGTPGQLISDRGTSFTSNEFKGYIASMGIKHTLNAVATPRANGQIERYNRSILSSLTALCHDNDDRDWDIKVRQVQWSLNNTVNQSTGKSPTEIVFGRPTVGTTEGQLHDINQHEEIVAETVRKIREEASEKMQTQQDKMKTRYNQNKIKAKTYKEGELVMIQKNSKTAGESHKLDPPFSGPYKVTAVLAHDRYEISSVDGYSKKNYKNIFSVDKIKPWVRFVESESESEYGESE